MRVSNLFFAGMITGALIVSGTLNAQTPIKKLQLNEAIQLAEANNKTLKESGLNSSIASEKYKQSSAMFMPQVDLSYSALFTDNPLNAFGFNLQQGTVTAADFDPSKLNNPSLTKDFGSKIEVMEPLINPDLFYQRKAAKKGKEIAELQKMRTSEYVAFQVKQTYMELALAYDAKEVIGRALATSAEGLKRAQSFYDEGLIQRTDLLDAQIFNSKLETDLSQATNSIQDISDRLSLVMGTETGIQYTIDKVTETAEADFSYNDHRTDFVAMNKAIEAQTMMKQASKMNFLPKLNAFGSYQYNDSKFAQFDKGSYLVGIKLSWNIFNGMRDKRSINISNYEIQKLNTQLSQQKDEAKAELMKSTRALETLSKETVNNQLMVEQAREALRILQDRYSEGLVSTTDLLRSQTQLAQTELALTQSVFKKNVTKAYIELLTETNRK
ncbi:MAG: TolC family protein [Porphyromonadaceae bacterium]|nr:TolC family protein [Porphyromonadaceae bacterium]